MGSRAVILHKIGGQKYKVVACLFSVDVLLGFRTLNVVKSKI